MTRSVIIGLALAIGGITNLIGSAWHSKTEINALPLKALVLQRAWNTIADINSLAHAGLGVASLSERAGDSGTKIWLILVGNKVPLGVGRSPAEAIVEDLPEGVDDTRTVPETNDNVLSWSLVVVVVELVGIVVAAAAATKSTLTATVLITDLELGKVVLATSVGMANEPVASIVEDNVQIGNVALLLADTELLGSLEGLVNGHDRSILLE